MERTEPTGPSAICTWAPLARSPTSVNTAVAVRCPPPPETEHPASARTSAARTGTAATRRLSDRRDGEARIRTTPPRRAPSPPEGHVGPARDAGGSGPGAEGATA